MSSKKISTTVYLTEDQMEALKELNFRTRVPIAEYIRLGVDLILNKHSELLPGQMSLFNEDEALGHKPKKSAKKENLP